MADENKEQNIDQQASTSQIDQITKIPAPKPKAKNSKRVAAGKQLSEYNKKEKEQQKLIQENDEEENHKEENHNDRWLPKTSFTSIIALIGLGLTALDLFLRYKSQRNDLKIAEKPDENLGENPVEQVNSDVAKINVSVMKHNVGME